MFAFKFDVGGPSTDGPSIQSSQHKAQSHADEHVAIHSEAVSQELEAADEEVGHPLPLSRLAFQTSQIDNQRFPFFSCAPAACMPLPGYHCHSQRPSALEGTGE
jgi:hypothetical protein